MSATRTILGCGLVALSFCLSLGCDETTAPPPPKPPPGTRPEIKAHDPKPTTQGNMAMHNLREGIKQMRRAVKEQPKSLEMRKSLVGGLMQRAKYVGKIADYDEALRVTEKAVELHPKTARAYRLRASLYAALHRFDDALADLDKAEELGTSANDTRLDRGTIKMGLGKYDEAYEMLHAHRKKFENTLSCALEASLLGRMGKFEEADKLFLKALELYRSTSPFTVAWLYFEQGAMWDRNGDPARARQLYGQALEKLPVYAHAAAHLAALSPADRAETLLQAVVKRSDDPEYAGSLAVLLDAKKPGAGDSMRKSATLGYQRLMERHQLAFADHAGWFYLNVAKDPDKAVEVGEANVKARQVPEAYELLVAAQLGAKEIHEACRTANKGLELKYPSLSLKAMAAKAFATCGRTDRAAKLDKELEDRKPAHGKH